MESVKREKKKTNEFSSRRKDENQAQQLFLITSLIFAWFRVTNNHQGDTVLHSQALKEIFLLSAGLCYATRESFMLLTVHLIVLTIFLHRTMEMSKMMKCVLARKRNHKPNDLLCSFTLDRFLYWQRCRPSGFYL